MGSVHPADPTPPTEHPATLFWGHDPHLPGPTSSSRFGASQGTEPRPRAMVDWEAALERNGKKPQEHPEWGWLTSHVPGPCRLLSDLKV